MSFDIRKKEKNVKAEEFMKEMKDRYEEIKTALIKSQEKMKRQTNKNRKEAEKYKVGDEVLISTKDFLMKLIKKVTKKSTEKYIGSYVVKKIILENMVELELPVVNIRRIVKYQEQVEGQKKIPPSPVEIEGKEI